MRIAVSSASKDGLSSRVSGHFGGSPCFVFVDLVDGRIGNVISLDNPSYPQHGPGQVPAFVIENGANVLLTGGMGAHALELLQHAGVEARTGASGAVSDAIQQYLDARLSSTAACQGHHGQDGGEHHCHH